VTHLLAEGEVITYGADSYADPHSLFQRIRDAGRAVRVRSSHGVDAWYIAGYDDVRAAFSDPRLSRDSAYLSPAFAGLAAELGIAGSGTLAAHMMNADPPHHARLRRPVTAAFGPRRIALLEARVAGIAEDLLSAFPPGADIDLVTAFAQPLPVAVICELLGVRVEDREQMRAWSKTLVSARPSDVRQVPEVARQLTGYLSRIFAERRREPRDDLVSALIGAAEDGDRLSGDELFSTVILLIVAGHETTVNLISNTVYTLLTQPRQRAEVMADPALWPGLIEEVLRFEPPAVTAMWRFATEDIVIGGALIKAGEPVLLAAGATGRDPGHFARPDDFDPHREDTAHLAFGHGVHYCLGSHLARLEARVAVSALFRRFPGLTLAGRPEEVPWRTIGWAVRGPDSLAVRL
jgi:cytochrome P450